VTKITLEKGIAFLPNGEEVSNVSLDLIRAAPDMLDVLQALSLEPDIQMGEHAWECRFCGREYSVMMGDNELPEICPDSDCPGYQMREVVARATGTSLYRLEAMRRIKAGDNKLIRDLIACINEGVLSMLLD